MSEYKLKLLVLINKGGESSPFRAYIKGELPLDLVVKITNVTSTNPKSGLEREEMKISHGDTLVVSHDREWFSKLSRGFITPEGFGLVRPFEDAYPSAEEVLSSL
jgi:hypothetical protein